MNHTYFEELIAAETLGTLSVKEKAALQRHRSAGCERCQRMHHQFASVSSALALPSIERMPASSVKMALLHRLQNQALYAHVLRTQGRLTLNGQRLKPQTKILSGQTFSTGHRSTADLRIPNIAILRVGQKTRAYFVQQKDQVTVELETGFIISRVKTGTPYTVHTAATTVEARGTLFIVKKESARATYVCLCQGKILISAPDLQQELSGDHEAVLIRQERSRTHSVPDTLRHHIGDQTFLTESF